MVGGRVVRISGGRSPDEYRRPGLRSPLTDNLRLARERWALGTTEAPAPVAKGDSLELRSTNTVGISIATAVVVLIGRTAFAINPELEMFGMGGVAFQALRVRR
jgi:hypothetical protein